MKTILVPTDYSEVADNALNYAVELAKFSKAKLILMHAYQVPVPTGDIPVMLVSPMELAEINQKRVKKLEHKITKLTAGKIKVGSVTRSGFTVEEISNVIKEKNIDLVIMGITGVGEVSEKLIGSHTTSLIKQTKTPVLIIPKDAKYKKVEKMILACNYSEPVNVDAVKRLKAFAKLFDAKVLVLDVEKPAAVPMYENTAAGEKLGRALKDVDHVMFYGSSNDLTDELNSFADAHKCDWVAMIPHKHNLLSRLFHESNTKKMAFHTHLPLLSIHD